MMQAEKTSKKSMPKLLVVCITVFAFLFLIVPLNLHDSNKRVSSPEKETVEVIMAKRALTAGTVITLDDIKEEDLSKDELPQGNLVGPVKVIGRVLARPVVEDQVLTEACLVPEGTASIRASQIPVGSRVISVLISIKARPDYKLLHPDCVVDVLVSHKPSSRDSLDGEPLYTTIVKGIRVLAISGDSGKTSSRRDEMLVSLLVWPTQQDALARAILSNRNISLSLRKHLNKIGDFPIEKDEIWDIIDYWQLLPENRPRRTKLLISDKLVEN